MLMVHSARSDAARAASNVTVTKIATTVPERNRVRHRRDALARLDSLRGR
jgi:hypothetical protein